MQMLSLFLVLLPLVGANLDELIALVRSRGVFAKVEIREPNDLEITMGARPGLRGMFAVEDIKEGELIYDIPYELIFDGEGDLCKLAWQIVELMRGNDAKRAPYLDSVPGSYDDYGLPWLWDTEYFDLVNSLPPSDWFRHVEWWNEDCGGDLVNDPLQIHALAHTVSRSVGELIVPLFDLTNHDDPYDNIELEVDETAKKFRAHAYRAIAKGEEVTKTYGRGATRIFRDFGFLEAFPRLWDSLPGDHEFWIYEDGTFEWQSEPAILSDLERDLNYILDLTALDVHLDDHPDPKVSSALAYRKALRDGVLAAQANAVGVTPVDQGSCEKEEQEQEQEESPP